MLSKSKGFRQANQWTSLAQYYFTWKKRKMSIDSLHKPLRRKIRKQKIFFISGWTEKRQLKIILLQKPRFLLFIFFTKYTLKITSIESLVNSVYHSQLQKRYTINPYWLWQCWTRGGSRLQIRLRQSYVVKAPSNWFS